MLEKKCVDKSTPKSSVTDDLTRKINEVIDGWPQWKKEAYNENFAISAYSSKLK